MKPRYYQTEAVDSIFNYYFNGNTGNPVIAMPTGTGKSIVIADFNRRVLSMWPNQRILNLTHVKELIEQNTNKMLQMWNHAPVGVYSAGLGERTTNMPIIFGGVQSVKGNIAAFGHRDLVVIDECHLLSPKDGTMYQLIIDELRQINPFLKVIGLSATPYRLGQGLITDGGLFTDVCYDITGYEAFNRLLAEGYLCPPIPKPTNTTIDTSNIAMCNGDFAKGALDEATDKVLYEAVKETVQYGHDRKCWLGFAPGIKTSEHAAEMLRAFGISAAAIHNKISDEERDERIRDHKNGTLRCLINNNVLTTGYDNPMVDFIPMYRSTMSPGLWVQMLGRGTRPVYASGFDLEDFDSRWAAIHAGGKQNCLVLDFAGNTRRLGPINDPVKPRKKGDKPGDAPIRICDACGCYNHASARECAFCGHEFKFQTKIKPSAAMEQLLRSDAPIVDYYDVQQVFYINHTAKHSGASIIKASYVSGFKMFHEFINFESNVPFVKKKAHEWWRQRHFSEPPKSTAEALQYISQLRPPRRIRVWLNKQYPEILSYEY